VQSIEKGKVKPGTIMRFSAQEVKAYLQYELAGDAPPGVRQLDAELHSGNTASGSALVDFVKLRSAQGKAPNWLIERLLSGEHRVSVTVKVESGDGKATVEPVRVEVAGVPVSGAALDFLVQNYLIPNFPTAKVGKPFDLKYGIQQINVSQGTAYVLIE
jgi:hypothetical protein